MNDFRFWNFGIQSYGNFLKIFYAKFCPLKFLLEFKTKHRCSRQSNISGSKKSEKINKFIEVQRNQIKNTLTRSFEFITVKKSQFGGSLIKRQKRKKPEKVVTGIVNLGTITFH